jgi:peroxiredoxin Q/BCP
MRGRPRPLARRSAIVVACALALVSACRVTPGPSGSAPPDPSAAAGPEPVPLDTSWEHDSPRLLAVGDRAPDFEGIGHTGMRVKLSSFLDKPACIYFYGKDGADDATAAARGFRDAWMGFHEEISMVFGVSTDDRITHRDFATLEELPFVLVADENRAIARAFGVPSDGGRDRPVAFVVGTDGKIRKVFSELGGGRVTDVVAALEALGTESAR